MKLSIHQVTSLAAGFQRSLEGWQKAGVKNVELTAGALDDFLKSNTLSAARHVLDDLGLTAVSCGAPNMGAIWLSGEMRSAALDNLKSQCDRFAVFGTKHIVCPTGTNKQIDANDYAAARENIREVGDIAKQFGMTVALEFTRNSPFISTLPTALKLTRDAAHPNVRPMIDTFHFWAGPSKVEDLDLIRPGEIAHVHLEDVPDEPREMLTDPSRMIPGDGTAPLAAILRKLATKGYSGALSVELFAPRFQQGDPYEVARTIRQQTERLMRQANVI